MRKGLLTCLAVIGLACLGQTEAINAVYFNPSRFGNYNALRIMDKLQVEGNITVSDQAVVYASVSTITNDAPTYLLSNTTGKQITATNTLDMPNTEIKPQQLSVRGTNSILFSNENAQSSVGRITGVFSATAAIYADKVDIDASGRNLVLGKYSNRASGVYDGQSSDLTGLSTGVQLQLAGVPIKSIYYTINNTARPFTSCKSTTTSAPQLRWYDRLASTDAMYKVLGCEPETYSADGAGGESGEEDDEQDTCYWDETLESSVGYNDSWLCKGSQYWYEYSCSNGESYSGSTYKALPVCERQSVGNVCSFIMCDGITERFREECVCK